MRNQSSKDATSLDTISALINQGKWRDAWVAAFELGLQCPDTQEGTSYWFKMVLIAGKLGKYELRDKALENLRRCKDFTILIEGDVYRDEAILALNQDPSRPAALILAARRCHSNDHNRLACLTGVEGRLEFRQGNLTKALALHREADRQWSELGDRADQQWVTNNLSYWLFAALACSEHEEAAKLIKCLEEREQNQQRLSEARVAYAQAHSAPSK